MEIPWQPIASILGPMLGAGVASYLGVRFGIGKYRVEKAFENRLLWNENTYQVVVEYAQRLQVLAKSARMGFSQELQGQHVDNVIATVKDLLPLLNRAACYADPRSLAAIEILNRANRDLLALMPRVAGNPTEGFTWDVERIEKAASFAHTVGRLLASELRKHLRLEPLEPTPSRFRFLEKRRERRRQAAAAMLDAAYLEEIKDL